MYCVIQKVQRKKPDTDGHAKKLLVEEDVFTVEGKEITEYSYWFSKERFERPVLDAYKISIHHSYRENGKIKKKQWSLCTMGYYDFVYSYFEDMVVKSVLDTKIAEMGIKRSRFFKMVYDKLNPIEAEIRAEYEQTEEYKTHQEHQAILKTHISAKKDFDELYGKDMYSRIYDVFGTLHNKELLDQLIKTKGTAEEARKAQEEQQRANEEYRKRSEEEQRKRFEEDFKNYSSGGSYSSGSGTGNYTDDEKAILKDIYRMASKKFHPDITKDDGSKMKFITKLKEQWGI